MQAFYFIVTTITTVGYGDMSGFTLTEHVFCIILMLFGVFLFSTISGSLAAVLATIDVTNAELQAKVVFLKRLKSKFNIPPHIYKEINRLLSFENKMEVSGLT